MTKNIMKGKMEIPIEIEWSCGSPKSDGKGNVSLPINYNGITIGDPKFIFGEETE